MADEQNKPATTPAPAPRAQGTGTGGTESKAAEGKAESRHAAEGQGGGESGADKDRRYRLSLSSGGVTSGMAEEYEAAGVDPAYDNRIGRHRPVQAEYLKPQQVQPAPAGREHEWAEAHGEKAAELTGQAPAGEAVGMTSVGPLGRGTEVHEGVLDEDA